MRRVGQVIRLRPEREAEYRALHRAVPQGVLDALRRAGVRSYSIYLRDGLLFAYLEHDGDDYDADMAALAQDPATREWWTHTDPCQEPVASAEPGQWWADADEVFHLE